MKTLRARLLLLAAVALSAVPTSTSRAGFQFVILDVPDSADGSFAAGINNAGQIVGHANDAAGKQRGFLYSGGAYTFFDPVAEGGFMLRGSITAAT